MPEPLARHLVGFFADIGANLLDETSADFQTLLGWAPARSRTDWPAIHAAGDAGFNVTLATDHSSKWRSCSFRHPPRGSRRPGRHQPLSL